MTAFFFRHGTALTEDQNARVVVGKTGVSGKVDILEACYRCGGMGGWKGWPGFTCYRCGGACKEWRTHRVFTADKLASLEVAAEKRAAKKVAEAEAKAAESRARFDQWVTESGNADLVAAIKAAKGNTFLGDLARQMEANRMLSDAQLAAADKVITNIAEQKVANEASSWVGEVGERIDLDVTVEGVFYFEGQYGTTSIVKMRDTDGNVLTWFKSGYMDQDERGNRFALRGTVKKHDVYREVNQTVLTRCKMEPLTVMTADEAAQLEQIA